MQLIAITLQKPWIAGQALVLHVSAYFAAYCHTMLVGTGAGTATVAFYEKCGFRYSHRIPGFFTRHYDHPMVEDGALLVDMAILSKKL